MVTDKCNTAELEPLAAAVMGGSSSEWSGGAQHKLSAGETAGLLLRRGSLSVYLKGQCVGVMVSGLSGQLVWATDLSGKPGSVRIERKPPPR